MAVAAGATWAAAVSEAAAWASTMGMAAIGTDIGAAYPHTTITAMGTNDVKRSWAIPAAVEEWPHLGLFFWRRASTITGDIFMPSLQRLFHHNILPAVRMLVTTEPPISSALSHSNRGYSLFSFTRASAVVNCQSALV
jgi:hypothetical protein